MKENIKAPRHWPLCGEFTGTGEFPAQRASNAENVPIWLRHHGAVYYAKWESLYAGVGDAGAKATASQILFPF